MARVFSDIAGEPDIGMVTAGTEKITEFKPDTVICLGGGAAIDAAKAIVFIARKTGAVENHVGFIAIPTTSGTGSEVSRFAVITDKTNGIKYPLIDDSLLPDVAVLDAQLVMSAPPSVTADTGIDVFTHAVEAFVSTGRNDFSDACAEKAIKLVNHYLMAAYKNPNDAKARQGMHNASCLAGVAFSNAGLGLNHGMAHAMGAKFHTPHGRAKRYSASVRHELQCRLCRSADTDRKAVCTDFQTASSGYEQCSPERTEHDPYGTYLYQEDEYAVHDRSSRCDKGAVRGRA